MAPLVMNVETLVMILAVMSGIAAVILPISQRLSQLSQSLEKLEKKIEFVENGITRGAASDIASIKEKFIEINTQLNGVKELMSVLEERIEASADKLDVKLQLEIGFVIERMKKAEDQIERNRIGREK